MKSVVGHKAKKKKNKKKEKKGRSAVFLKINQNTIIENSKLNNTGFQINYTSLSVSVLLIIN